MVERNLAKVEVESSSLFSRSKFKGQHFKMLPFLVGKNEKIGRGNKAVMYRIANPASPVRLRAAPPSSYSHQLLKRGFLFDNGKQLEPQILDFYQREWRNR